jgi:hypothetical protein
MVSIDMDGKVYVVTFDQSVFGEYCIMTFGADNYWNNEFFVTKD